jgi:hypothetical protein
MRADHDSGCRIVSDPQRMRLAWQRAGVPFFSSDVLCGSCDMSPRHAGIAWLAAWALIIVAVLSIAILAARLGADVTVILGVLSPLAIAITVIIPLAASRSRSRAARDGRAHAKPRAAKGG